VPVVIEMEDPRDGKEFYRQTAEEMDTTYSASKLHIATKTIMGLILHIAYMYHAISYLVSSRRMELTLRTKYSWTSLLICLFC
jgi:hypothetical protein